MHIQENASENLVDATIKLLLSFIILMAALIFSSQSWAAKPTTTGQQYLPTGSFEVARHWRDGRRGWRWRRGWRRGYYPPYWGPWRPYWRGGVYCRKRCLTNRWGRIIRCRVSCY